MNHFIDMKDNSTLLDEWLDKYGNVVNIGGFFGVRQIVSDAFLYIFIMNHFASYLKENRLLTTDGSGIICQGLSVPVRLIFIPSLT
jgi:hypothetical protein